jgi:hypothetical protein
MGRDPLSFAETVAAPEFPSTEYVLRSRYWWQLEPFFDAFPADRIRVVLQEELAEDPAGTLRELYSFAGVEPDAVPAGALQQRLHGSDAKLRPPAIVRRLLLPGAAATAPPPSRRRAELVERLTARFGRPIPRPSPGPGERARIAELVNEDVARLARFLGRPLWGVGP